MSGAGTGPRIAVTPGEPAGIGPDIVIEAFQEARGFDGVVIADPNVLRERAERLGLPLAIEEGDTRDPGRMTVLPLSADEPVTSGVLERGNADYVLRTLRTAVDGCLAGDFAALVTGPVQKSILDRNDAPFTGHTGFLRDACDVEDVVMMLVGGALRVALATTHVPLGEVPALITSERIDRKLRILMDGLRSAFAIDAPRVAVAGLNPHAGEAGHRGSSETEVLEPVCRRGRGAGAAVEGPLPADTIFQHANEVDAILAMYHDQGLPVLKYASFGTAVNVTLGLPFPRTSVDHGTALDLAGKGSADAGSLLQALAMAVSIAART
ncbi:MAG: 4-hydroxythreonine-4-phosphate dehydrogenase PdxA [Gammaproteobacteria bacterium]|nr:4-hydroxythreonine-4-phosphate dehydrogenase PdxA [Gammaproteobacteria bacterium]